MNNSTTTVHQVLTNNLNALHIPTYKEVEKVRELTQCEVDVICSLYSPLDGHTEVLTDSEYDCIENTFKYGEKAHRIECIITWLLFCTTASSVWLFLKIMYQ